MVALSTEELTNVVLRALPFHFTTEVDTNPVPFTVSVKPLLPGATLAGTERLIDERHRIRRLRQKADGNKNS